MDAFAVPFVQGQLRGKPLSVAIKTECTHCTKPLHIEIDSELRYSVEEKGANPIVFVPLVNFAKLTGPNIIDAF
jgi:hypothetical protein